MTDTERYEYIIYKICSDECEDFYIGSTRNMVQRRRNHKNSCNVLNNPKYNYKIYRTIRDNDGWENWRMVPLEKMENSTKFEAECREEVVRCEFQAKMNSRRATLGNMTREEYNKQHYQENIDHIKEYKKQYRQENIDQIRERDKKYNEKNKEQIREQKKQYQIDKKEQIREHKKKYYQEKKEQIKKKQSEKIDCECGGNFAHGGKARHFRTKKHQLYLDNLEKET